MSHDINSQDDRAGRAVCLPKPQLAGPLWVFGVFLSSLMLIFCGVATGNHGGFAWVLTAAGMVLFLTSGYCTFEACLQAFATTELYVDRDRLYRILKWRLWTRTDAWPRARIMGAYFRIGGWQREGNPDYYELQLALSNGSRVVLAKGQLLETITPACRELLEMLEDGAPAGVDWGRCPVGPWMTVQEQHDLVRMSLFAKPLTQSHFTLMLVGVLFSFSLGFIGFAGGVFFMGKAEPIWILGIFAGVGFLVLAVAFFELYRARKRARTSYEVTLDSNGLTVLADVAGQCSQITFTPGQIRYISYLSHQFIMLDAKDIPDRMDRPLGEVYVINLKGESIRILNYPPGDEGMWLFNRLRRWHREVRAAGNPPVNTNGALPYQPN